MPQIFHPSLNTLSRVSIFGALLFVAGAVALGAMLVRSPYFHEAGVIREQPVPFYHKHHVGGHRNRLPLLSRVCGASRLRRRAADEDLHELS